MGWYGKNAGSKTHPVGEKSPNGWGLYDMHGNVWEWCEDRYDKNYYQNSPNVDPKGPSTGSNRVDRGAGWNIPAVYCRSADRSSSTPGLRFNTLGFRFVRTAK
jgi:formylglycine-generating enzyme required for sulfatase activity